MIWVCTFFTKFLISGYFVPSGKAHVMYLSINSTTSLSSFSSVFEHLLHEFGHLYAQSLNFGTPFDLQNSTFEQ